MTKAELTQDIVAQVLDEYFEEDPVAKVIRSKLLDKCANPGEPESWVKKGDTHGDNLGQLIKDELSVMMDEYFPGEEDTLSSTCAVYARDLYKAEAE